MKRFLYFPTLMLVCVVSFGTLASAQTTAFTYQGSLDFSGQPANGNFDFEFALFDAAAGGSQLGGTLAVNNVPVANGSFSVALDFGNQFPGPNRFLEIRVRQAGQPGITTLAPRQQIRSAPYALRSISAVTADSATNAATATNATNAVNATNATTATNALSLGGVAANQYVLTGDSRLSDARSPLPGSANYIQNTTNPQTSADFNISGTGQANILRAETQFNIGSNRVLSSPSLNTIFAGAEAGAANTIGDNNSFFGARSGEANTSGGNNSFFGRGAGQSNESGSGNSFLGRGAGVGTQTGGGNSFVGTFAGSNNVGGSSNSALGADANMSSADLSFATAIGAGTVVSASNTVALGRPADTVQIPGSLNVSGAINGTVANATTATNALNLGGVAANQFVQTGDSRLSDARSPLPGSANYVQNSETQQAASNFNISGNGTAGGTLSGNIVNAATQFNLGGVKILSSPGVSNLFAGQNAGQSTTGNGNSFFGNSAGSSNTTSDVNSFFGVSAGVNTTGAGNSFFGAITGSNTTTGINNAFFGIAAGLSNSTGSNNTLVGPFAEVLSGGLTNATAIGSRAAVSQSNSLVLGSISGVNSAPASTNVGIGTTAPTERLHVVGNGLFTGNLTVNGTINGPGGGVTGLNASNITSGTLANARLGLIPTANIADGAVTDAKIASVSGAKVTGTVANATTANNALNLGGVAADQYVQTGDARLSDARSPLPGSANYIQNSATQQAASNFNISGNGTVGGTLSGNVVNAVTHFSIGNQRVLGVNGPAFSDGMLTASNTFAGELAGASLTPSPDPSSQIGKNNSFFGSTAGTSQTTASENSFFGSQSGASTVSGSSNAFFGYAAGLLNTSGAANSFFGRGAGASNTSGEGNVFIGTSAGLSNTVGQQNTFVGALAGRTLASGNGNTMIGANATLNTNGGASEGITLIGSNSRASAGLSSATAIGVNSLVTQSDSLVLGSIAGVNDAANTTNVGIGTTAPRNRLEVNGGILVTGPRAAFSGSGMTISSESTFDLVQSFANRPLVLNGIGNRVGINVTSPTEQLEIGANSSSILFGGAGCPSGSVGIGLNGAFGSCANYTVRGDGQNVIINRPTGGLVLFREGNGSSQVLINPGGTLELRVLGASGGTALCRNASNLVAFCSSSLRYKTNIFPFAEGMSFIRRLRPIAYEWIEGGMKDVGFGAEDVAKIDTRFITYNDKGEVEGIKYDRMSAVFVNAFNEQQAEIDSLKKKLSEQQAEIEALKNFICSQNPAAPICPTKE